MAEFPPSEPSISVHNFSHRLMENQVDFQAELQIIFGGLSLIEVDHID